MQFVRVAAAYGLYGLRFVTKRSFTELFTGSVDKHLFNFRSLCINSNQLNSYQHFGVLPVINFHRVTREYAQNILMTFATKAGYFYPTKG